MARIYLVEDDAGVREQLSLLLSNAGHSVECASRFDAVADAICQAAPDAAILDLSLPGTDGHYIARELRQKSDVPLMILTSRSSEIDELMSLTVGADDFVAKSTNPQLVLAHLEALLRRGRSSASSTVSSHGVTLDLIRSEASYQGSSTELSRNELKIMELLLRRENTIVSREDLMEALWASDAFVDDNTLTVNINRVRRALAKLGLPHAIVTHRGQGYALSLEEA